MTALDMELKLIKLEGQLMSLKSRMDNLALENADKSRVINQNAILLQSICTLLKNGGILTAEQIVIEVSAEVDRASEVVQDKNDSIKPKSSILMH